MHSIWFFFYTTSCLHYSEFLIIKWNFNCESLYNVRLECVLSKYLSRNSIRLSIPIAFAFFAAWQSQQLSINCSSCGEDQLQYSCPPVTGHFISGAGIEYEFNLLSAQVAAQLSECNHPTIMWPTNMFIVVVLCSWSQPLPIAIRQFSLYQFDAIISARTQTRKN